ncbi:hypothetical protein ZHAS_00018425 [Anopheles sinensis]|uniref:Uncharacterized protein n=1 Tax=Anopheles sinensis TaxID=74873 RepID=A0A084WJK5_ANOSI|nr:hypothetical protein ZHAS_00018425 [Anopheles sinensis]
MSNPRTIVQRVDRSISIGTQYSSQRSSTIESTLNSTVPFAGVSLRHGALLTGKWCSSRFCPTDDCGSIRPLRLLRV